MRTFFPQKLSRRCAMVIFAGASGVACTSTGTFSRASRSVCQQWPAHRRNSASDTMTPSISSPCERKRSAQRRAVGERFYRAKLAFLRRQAVGLVTLLAEHAQNLLAPVARQHVREKSPVADDDAECGSRTPPRPKSIGIRGAQHDHKTAPPDRLHAS